MSGFVVTRELIKRVYAKYDAYINPVLKFILALIMLSVVNSHVGYMDRIDNAVIVLVVSLLCSILPLALMAFTVGMFILLHMYALAPECALVVGVIFFLMFLLYIRLTPKETIIVLLTPIAFMLKIPYVMPIAVGLLGGPASVAPLSFGVIIATFLEFIQTNATTFTSAEDDNMVSRIRFMVDGLLVNKSMLALIIVFAIVLLLVYMLRRRSMDYSWTVAVIAGSVAELMLLFISDMSFDLNYSGGGIIIGCILAALLGLFLQLFSFHLDYKKVEKVQFEDDDYYYYVKAVPKVKVGAPDKKVRKVQPSKASQPVRSEEAVANTAKRESASSSGRDTVSRTTQSRRPGEDGYSSLERRAERSQPRTVHTVNGTAGRNPGSAYGSSTSPRR